MVDEGKKTHASKLHGRLDDAEDLNCRLEGQFASLLAGRRDQTAQDLPDGLDPSEVDEFLADLLGR